MKRQPDIEIFLKDCSKSRILDWIQASSGPLGSPQQAGSALVYQSRTGSIIIGPAPDGFVSVHFTSGQRPWRSDIECAREAASVLACTVRCDPGDQYPNVHPASDIFVEITGTKEALVAWS